VAEFLMPSLGADMEDAVVVEWLVEPGSVVKRGDIVAVVETDKGAIEIEIYDDGTIDELLVPLGASVPVGTVLATLHHAGETAAGPERPAAPEPVPASVPPAVDAERPVARAATQEPAAAAPAAGPSPGRLRISPRARRRAVELGIDLGAFAGADSDAAITTADVEKLATAKPVAATAPAAPSMRGSIAKAMARSKRDIPHYYLSSTIDMTTALAWMEVRNTIVPVAERMLYSVMLVKAVALALERIPELNGRYENGAFQPSETINLGMAIALRQGGLVAPALMNANTLDLADLMRAFRDLATRARTQKLRSSELSSPTMTVTNLGEQGVEVVYPVIYPPQVAIVGFGSVSERPWVVDGEIQIRRVVVASLAADHRVSDGRRGALFLGTLNELLQKPEAL